VIRDAMELARIIAPAQGVITSSATPTSIARAEAELRSAQRLRDAGAGLGLGIGLVAAIAWIATRRR
jgi:hypothetical protein